ncbi:glutathione S-transferase family protein [Litoribacillus peritrichatus]|uniref:Glutathione S-transferase n=1 Tax=Litoribacillus peritrichatus TaxID=718191 RepID=A0ABP7ME71_9GAMM
MITVHHLNRSRSKRVLWLLEELNMPYELVCHERNPMTQMAPDSLKKIHPLGKAPIVVDEGVTLCESGAVMEFILSKDSEHRLRPASDADNYYQYLEWLHFAEGSLALPVITSLLMGMEKRSGAPLDFYIKKELDVDFGYIESTLAERAYFAGNEFTAADVMMTIVLEFADNLKLLDGYPKIHDYLKSVQTRPAYKKAAKHG